MGLVTLSTRELDRVEVIRRVIRRELRQGKAAKMLGLTPRQVRRLCIAYREQGPPGLASLKRGRPSNHRLPTQIQERAIELVRQHYADFGPTLTQEKLIELHEVRVGRETLRKWMLSAGLWLPRAARKATPHQPRGRRECFGELIQIDGIPSDPASQQRRTRRKRRTRRIVKSRGKHRLRGCQPRSSSEHPVA